MMSAPPKKVLVAEDNLALAGVVCFNLEQAGLQVVVANNGVEAWEALQEEEFDIVVTDQQMPAMTGEQLCQKMRQDPRLAQTPVIMVTAKGLELEQVRLREELGIQEVIAKPFSPRELVLTVQECLSVAASQV